MKREAPQDQRVSARWEHSSESCVPKQSLSKVCATRLAVDFAYFFPPSTGILFKPFPRVLHVHEKQLLMNLYKFSILILLLLLASHSASLHEHLQRKLPYLPWI